MRARDNPFRADRVEAIRYHPLDGTWDDLMARLAQLDYRAAVVGHDGSGKTTLLEDLAPRLAALGFAVRRLFINEQNREPAELALDHLDCRDIILFDGADLLGPIAWLRFKRRTRHAGGVVITAHRPGLLPTLVECRTTPDLLHRLVAEILGTDTLHPDDAALFTRHGGNIRDALRELYDM